MVGLHSPFGTIGNIKREYGYSIEYVLWGEPWISFLMQQSDAPRLSKQKNKGKTAQGANELKELLSR